MLAGDARYGVAPYSTPSQHGMFVFLETRAQVSCWRRACSLACAAVPAALSAGARALLLRPRPVACICNVLIIFDFSPCPDADR
jgi:hypothetical protein